jgi:Arc/MetJ-type ribon-helix-helix transcriptional regulator
MKISVSLTDEDVEYVDVYARRRGVQSRSAVIREALRLLQASELGPDYAAAWDDWPDDEQHAWDATVCDGLSAEA